MNKHEALYAVAPTAVVIRGDEAFDAAGNPVAYDEAAVQAYIDANAYKGQRAAAYPPIGDQLDAMWKGGEAEAAMAQTILAVKAEFPKA
jgi:hypothetical protein